MLHFESHGAGALDLLFVHGASQSATTWQRLVEAGRWDDFRLLRPDLPGHGSSARSTAPDADYNLPALGRALAAFAEAQIQNPFLIVATSLGANVATEALPMLSGCRGLFLVGASVVGGGIGPADVLQPNPNVAANFLADPSAPQLEAYLNEVLLDRSDAGGRAAYTATFRNTDPDFRRVLAESVGRGQWSDEIAALRNSGLPLALVFGKEEAVVRPTYLDGLDLQLWKGSAQLVPGAGHSVQLDAPGALAALLRDFADECFR